jgi:hypothetical protein
MEEAATQSSADQTIQHVLSAPEFHWTTSATEQPSIWIESIEKILKWLEALFGSISPDTARFLSWTPIIIASSLLLIVLILLFMSQSKVRPQRMVNELEPEKLLAPEEYEDLLQKCIRDGNWPYALRFMYLLVLSTLEKHRCIIFDRTLTNSQFIREFRKHQSNPNLHKKLETLTLDFEFAYYGSQSVSEKQFEAYEKDAKTFLHEISSSKS